MKTLFTYSKANSTLRNEYKQNFWKTQNFGLNECVTFDKIDARITVLIIVNTITITQVTVANSCGVVVILDIENFFTQVAKNTYTPTVVFNIS